MKMKRGLEMVQTQNTKHRTQTAQRRTQNTNRGIPTFLLSSRAKWERRKVNLGGGGSNVLRVCGEGVPGGPSLREGHNTIVSLT